MKRTSLALLLSFVALATTETVAHAQSPRDRFVGKKICFDAVGISQKGVGTFRADGKYIYRGRKRFRSNWSAIDNNHVQLSWSKGTSLLTFNGQQVVGRATDGSTRSGYLC